MEARIHAYLRAVASRSRATEQIGPFLATFTPHSANPYLNYAIPDDGAQPTTEEVAALVATFRHRDRIPRLEYIPNLAPAVQAALEAGGFTVERQLPLMVFPEQGAPEIVIPEGIVALAPRTDEEIMRMIAAQNEAYGEGPPTMEDVERRRRAIAAGSLAVLARDAATGEPAGGGICDVPVNGTTELAGIGVRPAFRRRGIAAALTAHLVRSAHAAGISTVFLMAENHDTARIYARIGFTPTGEILLISQQAR